MPNKKKSQNKPKVYCERCQRLGHLAEDCYTLMCIYCKKAGHDLDMCRSFQKDKKYVMDTARQYCKKDFTKPRGQPSENQPSTSSCSSNIGIEISNISTVGVYRQFLKCLHKDVIEISTPELNCEKAKMLVGINCPITMIKIGKLKNSVVAAKEVLTFEDAYGARVKTICLICLSIHVNNKTVLHPCRVISDDFYIETDGVFGKDFIGRSKIKPGQNVELAGIQIPFIAHEYVRGVLRVDELVEVPNADSDSDTLTGSGSEINS